MLRTEGTKNDFRREELKNHREKWYIKILHGQCPTETKGKVDEDKTWSWLKNRNLNKETERLILWLQIKHKGKMSLRVRLTTEVTRASADCARRRTNQLTICPAHAARLHRLTTWKGKTD